MQQTLKDLLQRWRDGKLTDEELVALKNMLRSDEYQDEYSEILNSLEDADKYAQEAAKSYTETYHRVISQIDAAESNRRLRRLKVYGIAASVISLLAIGTWLFTTDYATHGNVTVSKIEYRGKQYVKLPDGTAVTLNDSSYLVYDSVEFGKTTRDVTLVGEAYFDVAHIPDRQFIVHTQDVSTKVLGTAFNVRAFKGQPEIVVTVTRGKVLVGSETKVFGQLLPDDEIVINTSSLSFEQRKVDADHATDWKSNLLIIDDVTMLEAAQIISQHFNTKVDVSANLDSCRVTAYFTKGESLTQVLDIISLSKNGNYEIRNSSATINGTCE